MDFESIRQEIRRMIGEEVSSVMKLFMDRKCREDFDYPFVGKVVDNNDPEKIGRCKIRVYDVHDKAIPDSDLPWAMPDMQFVGSKVGSFVVPPKDAIVRVYFDDGDIYLPVYTTKAIDRNNLPTQKDTDYPDNMVMYETDDGDYLTINRKTKVTTFKHNSGTKIIIQKNGSVEIEIVKDETKKIKGKKSEEVSDTITIKSNTDINIEATGNIDIKGTASCVLHGIPVPNGAGSVGGFCVLPVCPVTGAQLQTNKVTGGAP